MVAKRLLALFAAIAMIIGAVLVRRAMDDDAVASPDTPGEPAPLDPSDLTVSCLRELEAACQAVVAQGVQVAIETYDATLAKVGEGEAPDIWITIQPLWKLAVDAQGADVYDPPMTFASSPVVLVTPNERATVLTEACGGTISWRCVGDNSDRSWSDIGGQGSWGKVILGHADPSTNALGLAALGAAGVDFFGNATFNQTDIDADPGFFGWFSRLERPIPTTVFAMPSPLDGMLVRRQVNVVATIAADVATRAGAQLDGLTVVETPTRVDAVVALVDGADLDAPTMVAARQALLDAGWVTTPDEDAAMPSAGALRTLRDLWRTL